MNCYLMSQGHKHGTKPLVLAFATLKGFLREVCIYAANLDLVCNNTITFWPRPYIPSHIQNFPFKPPNHLHGFTPHRGLASFIWYHNTLTLIVSYDLSAVCITV
ncbi:hypothetical protein PAHAL_3G204800 [Panicum hallii]|uniref:Uncharacterized protein n=1 Tax=Panicum hallii TaxID=206008 RepID=A0A2S3HA86_9POAL|nr:hypothetical protein PAHAL_3G204800 [Panicum hallii]